MFLLSFLEVCARVRWLTVFCTACVMVEKTPLPEAAALTLVSPEPDTSAAPLSPPRTFFSSSAPSSSSSSSSPSPCSCASSPTEVLWSRRASPALVLTDVRLWPAHRGGWRLRGPERLKRNDDWGTERRRRTHGGRGAAQERFSPWTPTSPTFLFLLRWPL